MPGCIDFNIEKVVIFGDPGKSGKCPNFINLGHTSRGSSHQKIFTCGIWFICQIDPDLWGGCLNLSIWYGLVGMEAASTVWDSFGKPYESLWPTAEIGGRKDLDSK